MTNNLKHIIVLIIMQIGVAIGDPSFAQLQIKNPSFESNEIVAGKIDNWDSCYCFYCNATQPTPSWGNYFTPPPPDGRLYLLIGQDGHIPSAYTNLTTKISCTMLKNQKHKMSLWGMGYFSHSILTNHNLGYFTIHLGYHACDSSQLIYQSPIMYDTLQWYKYEFEFIPNDNYDYIGIQAHHETPTGVAEILIDNFSPIVVEIPNVAHIQVSNINGNCYNLQSSIANGIEAVRYEWKNQSAVIGNQQSIDNVCINEATTIYLTAWDKCGYAYTDSFNFTSTSLQYQYNSNTGSLNISLVPFDKPVQLQLYNDIGQLVNFAELPSQTTTHQFDFKNLTNGIYFLTLVSDKRITKQKIWKY
jgi:hypothetical protein